MISDTTYNGWKNRATWLVALWLDNDETLYNDIRNLPVIDGMGIFLYVHQIGIHKCEGLYNDLKTCSYVWEKHGWDTIDWDRIAETINEE